MYPCFDEEILAFAQDLFKYLINKRLSIDFTPLEKVNENITSYFTEKVGKATLLTCEIWKKPFQDKLKEDFPIFVLARRIFFRYVASYVFVSFGREGNMYDSLLKMSAYILEIVTFCYERGFTTYIYFSALCWAEIFKHKFRETFLQEGGWLLLHSGADFDSRVYDEVEAKLKNLHIHLPNVDDLTSSFKQSSFDDVNPQSIQSEINDEATESEVKPEQFPAEKELISGLLNRMDQSSFQRFCDNHSEMLLHVCTIMEIQSAAARMEPGKRRYMQLSLGAELNQACRKAYALSTDNKIDISEKNSSEERTHKEHSAGASGHSFKMKRTEQKEDKSAKRCGKKLQETAYSSFTQETPSIPGNASSEMQKKIENIQLDEHINPSSFGGARPKVKHKDLTPKKTGIKERKVRHTVPAFLRSPDVQNMVSGENQIGKYETLPLHQTNSMKSKVKQETDSSTSNPFCEVKNSRFGGARPKRKSRTMTGKTGISYQTTNCQETAVAEEKSGCRRQNISLGVEHSEHVVSPKVHGSLSQKEKITKTTNSQGLPTISETIEPRIRQTKKELHQRINQKSSAIDQVEFYPKKNQKQKVNKPHFPPNLAIFDIETLIPAALAKLRQAKKENIQSILAFCDVILSVPEEDLPRVPPIRRHIYDDSQLQNHGMQPEKESDNSGR